jgi:hypothetical protein
MTFPYALYAFGATVAHLLKLKSFYKVVIWEIGKDWPNRIKVVGGQYNGDIVGRLAVTEAELGTSAAGGWF